MVFHASVSLTLLYCSKAKKSVLCAKNTTFFLCLRTTCPKRVQESYPYIHKGLRNLHTMAWQAGGLKSVLPTFEFQNGSNFEIFSSDTKKHRKMKRLACQIASSKLATLQMVLFWRIFMDNGGLYDLYVFKIRR